MSPLAHPQSLLQTADEPAGAAADSVPLIMICAWCGRPLGRGASARRAIVSHGICRSCSDEVLFADTHDALTRR